MTSNEFRVLLDAILDRGSDRIELAREMFQRKYPEATEQMVSAAVFHLFANGADRARQFFGDGDRAPRDNSTLSLTPNVAQKPYITLQFCWTRRFFLRAKSPTMARQLVFSLSLEADDC